MARFWPRSSVSRSAEELLFPKQSLDLGRCFALLATELAAVSFCRGKRVKHRSEGWGVGHRCEVEIDNSRDAPILEVGVGAQRLSATFLKIPRSPRGHHLDERRRTPRWKHAPRHPNKILGEYFVLRTSRLIALRLGDGVSQVGDRVDALPIGRKALGELSLDRGEIARQPLEVGLFLQTRFALLLPLLRLQCSRWRGPGTGALGFGGRARHLNAQRTGSHRPPCAVS